MEIKKNTKEITKICSIENVIESWFERSTSTLITCWYDLGSREQMRTGFRKNIDAMNKFGAKYLITDLSKAKGLPHPSEESFFEGQVFPTLKEMKFDQRLIILPTNRFTKFGLKDFIDTGNRLGCDFTFKESLEDALSFIKAYHVSHYPALPRKRSVSR